MGLYPKIQAYDGGLEVVDVFRGLNHAEKISEGEWQDDLNLTADRFPMLSVRKKRTVAKILSGKPSSILAKDKLAVLTVWRMPFSEDPYSARLYYDGEQVASWDYQTLEEQPKNMISFGAYIIIPGINKYYNTADGTTGTISDMPKMDYVIESQNRLWGCYYGEKEVEENGTTVTKMVNEIYASSLGEFDEWDNYDGTSMASYAASVGTDGPWTGAISYQGKPHFFKESHVHKVYISATGAHQIVDNPLLGVQSGCSNSLCELDGRLYYMSRDGVCSYDGSTPQVISEDLGDLNPAYASFGANNGKLYAHLVKDRENGNLYVYDVKRGIWHEESCDFLLPIASFVKHQDSFYACGSTLDDFNDGGDIIPFSPLFDLNGVVEMEQIGENDEVPSEEVSYSCTSGLIGWQNIEQKYISRFDLRLTLPEDATMKVELEYDSSGTWEEQGTVHGGGTGSVVIPVRPRRCDHFRLRLSGTGEMRMYSWAKRLTKGSDVVL